MIAGLLTLTTTWASAAPCPTFSDCVEVIVISPAVDIVIRIAESQEGLIIPIPIPAPFPAGAGIGVLFTEPGTNDVSDIIAAVIEEGFVTQFDFISDPEQALPGTVLGISFPVICPSTTLGVTCVPEGLSVDVSVLLGLPTGLQINVTSDVEGVPEPGSLLLLAGGLALLASRRRKTA
jgi:hypothetical protein